MNVQPLGTNHSRAGFNSGVVELDRYFRSQAGRNAARRLAAVFVLVLPDQKIAGYYTLSPVTVFLPDLLAEDERKSSGYPPMAAAILSRLAVDLRYRGQGYGRHLLADAFSRVSASSFSSVAVIAEAEAETARRFYLREGFLEFPDRPDRLFRPMAGISEMVNA